MPQRPLAVFNIDGTIFRSSLFIELVNVMMGRGQLPEGMGDNYQAEYETWLNRQGSYDQYIEKMVSTFMANLAGIREADLLGAADTVMEQLSQRTYRYTRDLIRSLGDRYFLLAISGSPLELVSRFCSAYRFDDYRGTVYEVVDGVYTGEGQRGDRHKDRIIREVAEKHGLSLEKSIGVGDTESDIAFLELVEKAIAFNPSSGLFQHAAKQGWQVVVERKDVIYYPHV